MLHLSTLLKHYKRRDIQEAMVLASQDREVSVRFGDGGFGKRPDILSYPSDVLEFAKKGATSFHVSEERWRNVMQISTGMKKQELDDARKGWDLVLDIDCKLWDYSKLISHLMVQELRLHGIRSITAKFSGNKGFHIAVPFEAFPKEVHGEPIHLLFPDGVRRIAEYLTVRIKQKLLEHIKIHDSLANVARDLGLREDEFSKKICSNCKKAQKQEQDKIEFHCLHCENKEEGTSADKFKVCGKCGKIMEKLDVSFVVRCVYCKNTTFVEELDLCSLLQVDTVLISSRHLYRMPYSLHEKSGLCSIPIDPEKILSFEKEMAKPELVVVNIPFLQSGSLIPGEASRLILEAFDALPDNAKEEKDAFAKKITAAAEADEETLQQAIPAEFFPPCMKLGLQGLKDGKKRFMFMLVNFLLSTGYDYAAIDAILDDWNKKNPEPLRDVLLKGQVRYAQQTRKKVMPPNCDNQGYYKDMLICQPDGLCGRIKNPVQYAKRRAFLANLQKEESEEKGVKGMRTHLTDEQKEMRKKFREGKKEKVEEV